MLSLRRGIDNEVGAPKSGDDREYFVFVFRLTDPMTLKNTLKNTFLITSPGRVLGRVP